MAAGDLPGQSQVSGAAGSGQAAINSFDPTAVANSQQNNTNNLYGIQSGQAQDFANQYSAAVANNPSVQSLYNKANTQFNVPELASNANYLQNQVTNQLPMQQKLMRGFDATQEQVDNATNQNLRYLEPQATAAQNNLNTAEGLAQGYVNAGVQQNQFNLLPIQAQQQMVLQAQAAQATGWNQAAQNQFAGLQAKMQAGEQLSASEMQAYQQLASSKMSYDAAIAQSQATVQAAQIGAGSVLGAGQTYYNPFYTGSTYNPNRKV